MGSIYVTGDCHGSYIKFAKRQFRLQEELTREDVVIVCGDFGIWDDDQSERFNLDELSRRSFTTLFVDGNHDNFDRLCTEEYFKYMRGEDIAGADQGEFPLVDMYGGKVQKIRDGVYHLLRRESMGKGVKIQFHEDDTISIDLHIMVDNGVNLNAVGASIISEVRYVVTKCTGTEVRAVNVYIDSMMIG
jgi:uncharacterized alkaline shock family protein YloU